MGTMSNRTVSSGITSSGLTVKTGNTLTVLSGGAAYATTLSGGHVNDYGGILSGSVVDSAGREAR
jgi:autotransporter passenger strand-loop-strand repeat protein